MTTIEHDPYPCRDEVFYGLGVWSMGEDGGYGLLAEGHGRRTLAAISAQQRDTLGYPLARETRYEVIEVWRRVVETCGCTEEEHAQHVADDDGCGCEREGLPPCQEEFGWYAETAHPGEPGALAFTQVTW